MQTSFNKEKHIAIKAVCLAFAFLFPVLVSANYNDLTLTTSAVIQAGGYTFNVTGTSAVVQSITVNGSNFTVTLASGSSISISQPGLHQITNDTASDVASSVCNSGASSLSLAYSGAGTVTNTISASPTLCSTATTLPTPSASASTQSVSSGGGTISPQALAKILAPSASTTAYLKSLGIQTPPTTAIVVANPLHIYSFKSDLQLGSVGPGVKALQQYLNSHGFKIASSGPGSIGHETTIFGSLTKATLAKFQKAKGISPAIGYFGPLTRGYVQSHP